MKQTALITGASKGIGMELANIFAAQGFNLVLVARSADKLEKLKKVLEDKFRVHVMTIIKDLSKKNAVQEVFLTVQQENIHIDYLINNAGFGQYGYFVAEEWERYRKMIDLNITALTQLCHLFLPEMLNKKNGKILNIASTAAFQPGPLMAVYFASKSYVLHFSEALHNEVKHRGVTVTALCPGPTKTNFMEDSKFKKSRMVEGKNLPSAYEVAIAGYRAMIKGQSVNIPGFMNKMIANSVRFVPRKWAIAITRKLMD